MKLQVAVLAMAMVAGLLSAEALAGVGPKASPLSVKMTVREVKRDKSSYVVMLQTAKGDRMLPIWIGDREANAIQMRMSHSRAVRPLTHELLEKVIKTLGAQVDSVQVVDIQNSVFIGTLTLRDRRGKRHRIDGRPSDLITLAVGAGLPIYVSRHVLEKTGITVFTPKPGEKI